MSSRYVNINIEAGSDFSQDFELLDLSGSPLNLTGFTGTCQIRRSYTSDLYVYPLTVSITSPSTSGILKLFASATTTSSFKPQRYVYTVDITNGSSTHRVLEGIAEVSPSSNIN